LLLIVSFVVPIAAQESFVCVWRNPERTMTKLFPEAQDYRSQIVEIPATKLQAIEERIGTDVLPGQREQFQYYDMVNENGEIIGYTLAVTQKGEFGAIEFVFGLSTDNAVVGVYIQRSRERNREFKTLEFLAEFVGVSVTDAHTIEDPLGENSNISSQAVVSGIKKEMVAFDELILNR